MVSGYVAAVGEVWSDVVQAQCPLQTDVEGAFMAIMFLGGVRGERRASI